MVTQDGHEESSYDGKSNSASVLSSFKEHSDRLSAEDRLEGVVLSELSSLHAKSSSRLSALSKLNERETVDGYPPEEFLLLKASSSPDGPL